MSLFGVLSSLEMFVAMVIYLPVGLLADRGSKKLYVLTTFIFAAIFPIALYFSTSMIALILAFILRGAKEFGEPARKALILDLAPDSEKAILFGAYYLVRDLLVALSVVLGAWLWAIDPVMNLYAAFAFGVIGCIWFAVKGSNLNKTAD